MAEALLEVTDLSVDYLTEAGDLRAVDRVSFTVAPGEFLGIVGESGCGKSTLLFGVAQLLSLLGEVAGGEVIFRGRDMVRLGREELRHMRWRDYSVVMQSAMNALNPMKSIGAQFKDTLAAHDSMSTEEIRKRSAEVLNLVGIALEVGRVDPDQGQHLGRPLSDLIARRGAVRLEGVLELRRDAEHRVERVHRALHHHRVVAPARVAEVI